MPAGDIGALLARFSELGKKAFARTGKSFPIIVIKEAGLDSVWIHRVLQNEWIESHDVDPASIATSRRRRRAKTDKIYGEALVRTLLAYRRGEPRVCTMVKAPDAEEEDRRRLCRERKVLIAERIKHVSCSRPRCSRSACKGQCAKPSLGRCSMIGSRLWPILSAPCPMPASISSNSR